MSDLREMVDVFYEHVSSDDFSERRIEQGIRAIIEALAAEAEGRFRDGVWDSIQREMTYAEYWLRDYLSSDTEATDASQHHQQNR
jgi:hypothetical protein